MKYLISILLIATSLIGKAENTALKKEFLHNFKYQKTPK